MQLNRVILLIKMKFAICILVVIGGCQAILEEDALNQWQNYQEEFGKSYRSLVEHRHRFALFKQTLQEIEEHNKLFAEGKVTWYKGITPFSDWTREEFNSYINKYKYEKFNGDEQIFKSENLTAPASIDWRSTGAVSEVKDQGTCGSSWAFSSTGALEGAVQIESGLLMSLSEQNLLDCATLEYNGCDGCNGGNFIGAFQYVQKNGIATEKGYPYTGVQGACKPSRSVIYATGSVRVPETEKDLENAVSIGPVSVAIISTVTLQNYKGGVLNDASCAGQKFNHGVLVVGYGSENGTDYWILKNSWGEKWGESGYYRMIRGVSSCSITLQARFPLVGMI